MWVQLPILVQETWVQRQVHGLWEHTIWFDYTIDKGKDVLPYDALLNVFFYLVTTRSVRETICDARGSQELATLSFDYPIIPPSPRSPRKWKIGGQNVNPPPSNKEKLPLECVETNRYIPQGQGYRLVLFLTPRDHCVIFSCILFGNPNRVTIFIITSFSYHLHLGN